MAQPPVDEPHREPIGDPVPAPVFLAARLPPSWAADSQVLFEIYGNLWRVLEEAPDDHRPPPIETQQPDGAILHQQWQIPVGRHWALLSRIDDESGPVAAVAIRKASFSAEESQALGAVMGSVVDACSDTESKHLVRELIRAGTTASLKSEGPDLLAEVNADWHRPSATGRPVGPAAGRRTGVGRGSDPVTAVARAAAKACRPRCELVFAGASELDGAEVSIVMVREPNDGLRLGYAVRPPGDHGGPAEAVFTAAG